MDEYFRLHSMTCIWTADLKWDNRWNYTTTCGHQTHKKDEWRFCPYCGKEIVTERPEVKPAPSSEVDIASVLEAIREEIKGHKIPEEELRKAVDAFKKKLEEEHGLRL